MAQVDAIVKMKGSITKFQAPRKRDSIIEGLVLLVIGVSVVLAIAIVVIMVEFCGRLWLRPLSQDLFSPRVRPTLPFVGIPNSVGINRAEFPVVFASPPWHHSLLMWQVGGKHYL